MSAKAEFHSDDAHGVHYQVNIDQSDTKPNAATIYICRWDVGLYTDVAPPTDIEAYAVTDIIVLDDGLTISCEGPRVFFAQPIIYLELSAAEENPPTARVAISHSIFADGEHVFGLSPADWQSIRQFIVECDFPKGA